MEDKEKHIDESWKDNVARAKDAETGAHAHEHDENCGCGHDHEAEELEVNFFNYIMSMGYQAMIFLGEVPHPGTGKTEANLRQAKFLIDTLVLLREKTKGNLTQEEDNLLAASLYELQMKYVALATPGSHGSPESKGPGSIITP